MDRLHVSIYLDNPSIHPYLAGTAESPLSCSLDFPPHTQLQRRLVAPEHQVGQVALGRQADQVAWQR